MKYLIILCLIIMTSCHVTTGHYGSSCNLHTHHITPITTYVPGWWYRPRPYSLGNVYNNYYFIPRGTFQQPIRTNLPLQNGPRGGRRK